jgi:peptide/nickel transport system substrate-binding protein
MCDQLFDGLVQLDSDLNVIPAIARHWSILDSGQTYRFTLRNDVHFQTVNNVHLQNNRVKAQDFVFSFNRIINPQTASSGAWVFNNLVDSIQPFVALNDTTLVIKLLRPFPPFISLLTTPYASVVPQELAQKADFGSHPVGTGPFQFRFWEENTKLVLERNPNYFSQSNVPKVDYLEVSFIQNKQSAFLEFLQGNLDMYSGLESSFKDKLLNADGNIKTTYRDQFYLVKTPFLNTEYIAFNMDSTEKLDLSFRKAVNYAINKQEMVAFLRNNLGQPALKGFVPEGLPIGRRPERYRFDPQKAKDLLQQSRYTESPFTLRIHTIPEYVDLTVFIQNQLSIVGIQSSIEVMPPSLLNSQKKTGDLMCFRGSWIADYPDAESYLSCLLTKNIAPNGPNYTRYSNPFFDELYSRAIASNGEERLRLYAQMDSLMAEDAPMLFLFYDQNIRFYHRTVSGMQHNALNHLILTKTQVN